MTSTTARHPGAFGVHAPDRPGDGPFAYRRHGLGKRLDLLGMRDGGGAPVHWKIYDEAWAWREGKLPEFDEAHFDLLGDCRAFNFRPVVAYCPFTKLRPGDDYALLGKRGNLEASMEKFIQALPRGSAVILLNEREKSWRGDPATLNELEALFGVLARKYGMLWYVGADLVEASTIETIEARRAAWKRYGVEPDALAFHSYGQSGTLPRHVWDIWEALKRITGRTWKLIWTEWGWGFPGEGKARKDRQDLERAETGAWNASFALALAEADAEGCFFTLEQDFDEDGNPTAAAEEFAASVKTGEVVSPRPPPAQQAKERTFRYLSIGRSALGGFYARTVSRTVQALGIG